MNLNQIFVGLFLQEKQLDRQQKWRVKIVTPRYLSDSYDSADQTKYSVLLNWYPVIDKSIVNPTGSKNSSFFAFFGRRTKAKT